MLRRIDLRDKQGPVDLHLPRPDFGDQVPISDVRKIISGVREGGDASIRELTSSGMGVGSVASGALEDSCGTIPE